MAGGERSVMGLRALRKHCRLPTAFALIGVLLYTALAASHVVSQVTPRILIGAQGAHAQAVATVNPDCHDLVPAVGNGPDHKLPAPPSKKCPFCAGYAALNLGVVAASTNVPYPEAESQRLRGLGRAQLIRPASLISSRSRAPPVLS